MSFFDEEEFFKDKNTEEKAQMAENTGEENKSDKFVMPVGVEQSVEADFWADCKPVDEKNSNKKKTIIFTAFITVVVIIFAFMISVMIMGRGWLKNIIAGDENINFTLPVAEYPQLEDENYDSDGRFTTQGLATAVSSSVVSIEIYASGQGFTATSQGSGIIMSEDGYIVTNAHVVDSATLGIKVVMSDKTEYEAKIVGSDKRTDIAVLKIAAVGLQPAQFADSDDCSLGEDVVAIGSPAGFYGSVTKGIISGLDRQIAATDSDVQMQCIQIDAAINPGNSGGALFNMWGQVVGITSSKLKSESYDGIGFAITTNAAKPIIENLMEYGYVKDRTRVGIVFYGISENTASVYNTQAGLYVSSIDETCDIANSGLQVDDIITKMNGVTVTSYDEVQEAIDGLKPGDEVTAEVYRASIVGEGETFTITFKLMEDTGSLIS